VRRASLLLLASIFTLACGSTGTEEAGGAGGATITGVSSSSSSSHAHAASSSTSKAAASSSSGAPEGKGPPYPFVLAHGFFGFQNFAGSNFETYFYQLKDYLTTLGFEVYTPAVDPFNDSTTRGAELASKIQDILAETGAAKVNIVGHSQGGLDARVVAHDHPELVASVVTIATPHYGSPVADVALKLVSDPNAEQAISDLANLLGAPIYGGEIDPSSDIWKPIHLISQPGNAAINAM